MGKKKVAVSLRKPSPSVEHLAESAPQLADLDAFVADKVGPISEVKDLVPKAFSIELPTDLADRLTAWCDANGRAPEEIVRELVLRHLAPPPKPTALESLARWIDGKIRVMTDFRARVVSIAFG